MLTSSCSCYPADTLAVQNGELRTENEILKQRLQFEAEKHARDAQKLAAELGMHYSIRTHLERNTYTNKIPT